jgi:hypothetical protein
MKAVNIDERRIATRMALVDEHAQAEMDLDLDRTLATLNEAPDYKINDNEFSGRESVRAFYADFPDLQIEIKRRYVSDEAIILEATFSGWDSGHRTPGSVSILCHLSLRRERSPDRGAGLF